MALCLIDISISQKEFNVFFEGDRIQTYQVDSLTDSIRIGSLQFKTAHHFLATEPQTAILFVKAICGPGDSLLVIEIYPLAV